jgi:nucleotide-binding universal stress UspA family protein
MLVALEEPVTGGGLLRYATSLAGILPGLAIECLHVEAPGSPASLSGPLRDAAGAILPQARFHAAPGDVLDLLLDFASRLSTDLILTGHSPDRRGRRSLARRLAMSAPSSVWMVPHGSPPIVSRVLVPVDFSRQSAASLDIATALAEAAGLDECLALHVYFNEAAVTFDEFDEALVCEMDQAFGIFVAPVDLHGVFARPIFVESAGVARAVLRTAEDQRSDLIVMGTRGRSRSAAVLLGSETEQVLMATPVPLLAVKNFGARRRLLQVLRDERLLGRRGRFT